jgi:hypothetical protein
VKRRCCLFVSHDRNARRFDFVTLVDHRLLCSSAQVLFIRIPGLIEVPADDLRSGLNPDQPLVLLFIPGKLDSVSTHNTRSQNWHSYGS